MSHYSSILSFLRISGNDKWLRGADGSIPAALTATQMALLFVMAVFMTVLYTTPEMLTATVISLADEGSKMTEIPSFTALFFKPVAIVVSAIWCSCTAAGAVPRSI
ncbi:hypothetical protein YA0729_25185 [Pseudomonas simiae]|uniref:hypothetical protein n=1 Tax=Pseudomonas simiae TaxID=321846 RepID=UPI0018E62ACF|nr:hypothetical protein [Pseudomonas simiae]MBI6616039.1 hypothetical protein [Pseudomonas simiae]